MTGTAAPAEEKPGSKHRVLVCRGWSHEASIAGTDTGRAGPVFSPFSPKSHLHGAPRGCGGTGAALWAKSPGGKEKGKGTHSHEREVRRKEEGSRKMMWLGGNAVIWSFQITSAFYIVI